MFQTGRIMFVRADSLNKHPKAFQDYVKFFFKTQMFGDVEYCYAFLIKTGTRNFVPINQKQKGVALCHSTDLDKFVDDEGTDLYQYIKDLFKKSEKEGSGDVFEIRQKWNDEIVGHM